MGLKLKPDPTFKAKIGIPVFEGDPVPVEFTFKHRTQDALKVFNEGASRPDIDFVMDVITGWDLTDAFTRENVALLLQNYHGAGNAISIGYVKALHGVRLGN